MRKLLIAAAALSLAVPAAAALKPGQLAPDFTAPGAMAGKPFTVNLKAALKKGPVVLYFFPAAFTEGCNAEAHAFAEALPDFQKVGASVIGMTAGNIDKLEAFSAEKCAGKFAVAAASPEIVNGTATKITSRTSYVIAPDGKLLFVHSDMSPAGHIRLSLEAVQKYRAAHRH
jgi:thioredoxin-dependent peroxiredoxin